MLLLVEIPGKTSLLTAIMFNEYVYKEFALPCVTRLVSSISYLLLYNVLVNEAKLVCKSSILLLCKGLN